MRRYIRKGLAVAGFAVCMNFASEAAYTGYVGAIKNTIQLKRVDPVQSVSLMANTWNSDQLASPSDAGTPAIGNDWNEENTASCSNAALGFASCSNAMGEIASDSNGRSE